MIYSALNKDNNMYKKVLFCSPEKRLLWRDNYTIYAFIAQTYGLLCPTFNFI